MFSLRYEWKDKFCIVSERIWKFQIGHWFDLVIWSLVIGHWSLVIGHWSLVIGHWSFVIGHWSLVIGHWSLVIGHWSLVIGLIWSFGHWSFETIVIYFITCTFCNKLYVGETGKRLSDRFREHLHDVERNEKDASKPVTIHFHLPNHSKQHMAVCGLSLHLGSSESRKTLEQKFICQIGTFNPNGINEHFSFN